MKNKKLSRKNLKNSLAMLTLILSFTAPVKAEENLQEQEFHSIEVENTQIQNEKDFGYVISSLPTETQSEAQKVLYSIKNEYYESIKVVLEASSSQVTKPELNEFYLNAYQSIKDIPITSNAKIKIKVFNLYDQYLGFIQYDKKDTNIKISPFLLVPAEFDLTNKKVVSTIKEVQKAVDKAVLKDEIKDGVGLIVPKNNSALLNPVSIETKNTSNKPEPILRTTILESSATNLEAPTNSSSISTDTKPKKIKIANISDSEIHIIIKKPSGEVYGDSWTVNNDIYVPQFLNLQSEPIVIDSESTIIVTNTKTSKTIIKKATELNIDERGNYVLFVESFSNGSKSPEASNVVH